MASSKTSSTALLVMDFQTGIVSRLGSDAVVERARAALDAARSANLRVIFVRVAFRPGTPEVSSRNRSFSQLRERGGFLESDDGAQIAPALGVREGEVTVTKRRVSAFSGSDLEVVLRAGGITHLVLSGISTSGVVLSTLRQAADMDFELTVLSDACADMDPEVHRVLLQKVFPRQATVVPVEEWARSLVA